jgi:hypothetical protein
MRRDLPLGPKLPSEVRVDLIRQLHERPSGQEMADLPNFPLRSGSGAASA